VPTATGNWHSAKDVIWSDRTDVLGDAFAYLERHYPKLKEFFVSTLDVKEDVDPECYARQWLSLQSATQPDVERTEGMLGIIYRELLGVLRKSAPGSADKPNGSGGEVSWLDEFARKARIWCQHKEFCEPTECYVPDDWELRRLFQGAGIPFVWRGGDKASFSDFEPLYRLLRVNYLSECVWARLLDTAGSHALEEPVFLTHGAKGWILTCLKEKYPTEYDEFVKAGGHQALLATTEAESSELVLEFSLGTATREARYSAFWDGNRRCLFHLGGDTRRADVAERLAKEVLSDRRYKDFAEAIEVGLGESAEDGKRRIRKRNWRVPAEIRGILGDVDVPEDDLPRPPSSTLDSASTADGGDKELGEGVKADDIGEHPVHWPEQAGIKNRLGMASGEDRDEAGHTHSLGPGASRTGTTDVVPRVDYMEHFRKAFHRPSTESVIGLETVSPGEVRDPARRREATRRDILGGIGAEPRAEERFRFVSVRRWEPKNEATRVKLEEWYGGRCQICGVTFVKRDGTQYFEGLYIVSRTQADWIDRPGNVLCLCANCCAKFQHGSVESARDVAEQVRSLRTRAEGGSGECGIEVVLCGEAVQVRYQERHFIDLQELLKIVEGSDSADGEPSTAVHSVPCREAFEAAADVTGSGEGEDTEGQRSQSAVTPIPSTEDEMRETTSASATPMMKKTETARTVEVGNVIIPASMAGVVHGRKYRECDRWILASKGGVTIAVFATERDLDRWWRLFQKSQGRKPKSLAVGKKPQQSKV
jgi:hypothetical protein